MALGHVPCSSHHLRGASVSANFSVPCVLFHVQSADAELGEAGELTNQARPACLAAQLTDDYT